MDDIVQYLLSGATIISAIGYILHSLYVSHREFKKDVYHKLGEKVDKNDCRDFRHKD